METRASAAQGTAVSGVVQSFRDVQERPHHERRSEQTDDGHAARRHSVQFLRQEHNSPLRALSVVLRDDSRVPTVGSCPIADHPNILGLSCATAIGPLYHWLDRR